MLTSKKCLYIFNPSQNVLVSKFGYEKTTNASYAWIEIPNVCIVFGFVVVVVLCGFICCCFVGFWLLVCLLCFVLTKSSHYTRTAKSCFIFKCYYKCKLFTRYKTLSMPLAFYVKYNKLPSAWLCVRYLTRAVFIILQV